jgi:hypothetical protein
MEYDKFAQGLLVSVGAQMMVPLPFQPTWVEVWDQSSAAEVSAGSYFLEAYWQSEMAQNSAFVNNVTVSAGPAYANGTSLVTSGGVSTYYAGLALQYGASLNVSMVTAANPAVVTTSSPHGYISGDVVILSNLYQTSSTGMQQIAGQPFVVTVLSTTTFSIPVNTSSSVYTAYNSGTATQQATVKQVLYPYLYYPGVSFISAISLGSVTLVSTTTNHNLVVGQEVAFRIPSLWGTVQLNSLPNSVIPGSPVYGFVTVVNSPTQVTVNINSSAYTAFAAPAFSSFVGESFPQMVAVGDNNSGSLLFGFASNTINGPAISGAYLNNTQQGFVLGSGVVGLSGDVLLWRAGYSAIN